MCLIVNLRPFGTNLSSAEYIVKSLYPSMQSYGLPSGLYGFIDNQDAKNDIVKRVKAREIGQVIVIQNGFELNHNDVDGMTDDNDNQLKQYQLFSMFSQRLFREALIHLGLVQRNRYDDSLDQIVGYGNKLGFESDKIINAYQKFIQDWNNANPNDLLWSPITYVLKYSGYDGVCNLAQNNNSGGSVLLGDIEPRARGFLAHNNNGVVRSTLGKSKKKSNKRKRVKGNSKKSCKK